jgi:diguanylate cyclase
LRTTPSGGISRNEELVDVAREARDALDTITQASEILEEDIAESHPQLLEMLDNIRTASKKVLDMVIMLESNAASARDLAGRDPLTGAPNRRTLTTHAAALLRSDEIFSVLVIDVDRFKQVNDQHGHIAGDEVLKILVERCRRAVRESDVVARFAGDEFVILLPRTPAKEAQQVAARIHEHVVGEPFLTERGEIPVGVSIGVATRMDEVSTLEALLEQADHAMYEAKRR